MLYSTVVFDRRVHFQLVHAAGAEGIDAGVSPDVAPVSAVLSESECVYVRGFPFLVDENEFVGAAVKTAEPGMRLDPYTYIFQLIECRDETDHRVAQSRLP
jgi:hypothetical protein